MATITRRNQNRNVIINVQQPETGNSYSLSKRIAINFGIITGILGLLASGATIGANYQEGKDLSEKIDIQRELLICEKKCQ